MSSIQNILKIKMSLNWLQLLSVRVQISPHMKLNMRALHFYEIQIGYNK